MPKLPTAADLGGLPAPASSRGVASYDVSGLARGGAALAAGAERLGQGVSQVGADVGGLAQKFTEDKYVNSVTNRATRAAEVHEQFQHDTDYATIETRYRAAMQKVFDEERVNVPPGKYQRHYDATSAEMLARGAGAINQYAFSGLAKNDEESRKAMLLDAEARVGKDNVFNHDVLKGYGQSVDNAVGQGWIASKEAGDLEKRNAALKIAIRQNEVEYQRDPVRWLQERGYEPRMSKVRILQALNKAATENGINPDAAARVIQIESGGNPNARTGSYHGLTQISQSEFNKYNKIPGASIYDPEANMAAGFAKMRAEGDQFASATGKQPNDFDRYMIHQQGLAGYEAHLGNPNAPAWQNMLSTGEGKQKGAAWARAAIWGNIPDQYKRQFGSVENVSSADFLNMWARKYGAVAPDFNEPQQEGPPKEASPEVEASGWNKIDLLTRDRMVRQARQVQYAKDVDLQRAATVMDAQRKQELKSVEYEYLQDALSLNPTKSAFDASIDPRLKDEPDTIKRIVATIERSNKPEPMARVSQAATMGFVDRMRKPEGDPLKLTERSEITDAYLKGDMSRGDYEWTLKQFDDARGGGDSYAKARTDFVKRVIEPQIMKSDISTGLNNTRVGQRAYEFEQAMDRKKAAMLKEGKNPLDMFDPTKPDYMGKEEVLKPLRRTAQRDMNDMLNEEAENAGLPAKPAPLPAEPKDAKDLAQLQAMVRANPALRETAIQIATERGWVTTKPKTVAPTIPMSQ